MDILVPQYPHLNFAAIVRAKGKSRNDIPANGLSLGGKTSPKSAKTGKVETAMHIAKRESFLGDIIRVPYLRYME